MSHVEPAPWAWNYCPICGGPLQCAHDGESMRPHCAPCRRFYYTNPAPAVCCFVANEKGDLLVVQRAEEPCRGQWSFPGGYMEVGESGEETARRELWEETGLEAVRWRLFGARAQGVCAEGAVLLLGYVAEEWHGALKAPEPTMTLDFFTPEQRPPLCFHLHRELLADYQARERKKRAN